MERNDIIVLGILIILAVLLHKFVNNPPFYSFQNYTEEELLTVCSGMDLKSTAQCFKEFKIGIMKLRIADDNINQTFEELKENGGDCRDYSNLAFETFSKLGFFSQTHAFPMEQWTEENYNISGHQITIVTEERDNKTYICYIDILNYWCEDYRV